MRNSIARFPHRTVRDSIARLPHSIAITIFAGLTRAVEWGFLAAGITVAGLAAYQSIDVAAGWLQTLGQRSSLSWLWFAVL